MFRPISTTKTSNFSKISKHKNTSINLTQKTVLKNSIKPNFNITQNRWGHTSQHTIQKQVDKAQMADLRKQFKKEIGEKYNERIRKQMIEYKKFCAKVAAYREHKNKVKAKRKEKHRLWMRILKMEYDKLKAIRKNNRDFIQSMWSEWLKRNVKRMEQEDLSTGYIVAENLREGVQNAVTVPPEPYNIFGVPAHVFHREGLLKDDLTRSGEYHPGHWSTETKVDPNTGRWLPSQDVFEDSTDEGYTSFGPTQASDFVLEDIRRKAYGDAVLKEQRKTDFERWGLKEELEELERKGKDIPEDSLKRFGNLDSLQFEDLSAGEIEEQIEKVREWFNSSPLDLPLNTIPQQEAEEVDELFDTLRNFTLKDTEDKVKSDVMDYMEDQVYDEESQLKDFEDMLQTYDQEDDSSFDL